MRTLCDIINILPLSLLAVLIFGGYAGIPEESVPAFAVCLVFSLWIIALRNMTRKTRLRNLGIVAVFAVGLGFAAGDEYREIFVNEYFWVVPTVCISAAAFAAGILADRNKWVARAAAAALLIYCVTGTILGREISKVTFALICFVILVRLAEEIQRKWDKSGCPDMKEHITRISPVFLALCLIVLIIPAPSEPYDWKFAKDIFESTVSCVNRIYGYITHPSDDYGTVGFSDKGGFLAGLGENDEEVLVITAGNTAVKSCRLVGCISGDFNGREWLFDTETESCTRTLDAVETSCAVRKYAAALQSEYLQKTNMYCETYLYNTRYVFSPAKIRLEATKEKTSGLSERNGSIVSDRRFGYKDNYLISCYVLNYGNPGLGEFLGSAEPISEADWEQTLKAEDVTDKPGYSFEDYLNYRSDIGDNYGRSYGLSEDVGKILDEIKSGSSGRFETVKRLEAYLRTVEYSTDCGALPDSVTDAESFLDYFLFSSRKGYCMHFATAFVLMAREMGIPCRYVQGYNAKRDINGNMVVMQSCAHAWPEVYFDNAGWVAFEPTPGYYVPSGWGTYDNGEEARDEDEAVAGEDEKDETDEENEENAHEATEIDPLIFMIPTLAVVVFLVLFYVIGRKVSQNRYRRMGEYEKFRCLTQQAMRFLGYLGLKMESGETLSEYYKRAMTSDRQEIKEHLSFIPVYETVLYSDRKITEEDISSAENTCNTLRKLVKKSKLRYRLLLLIKKQ